jgi:AcrR family transcriptional regulator
MARTSTFDLDDVGRAGLAVVARDGWAGLTTRSVAAELGVTPMAIYRVVPDAAALRAEVADAAAGSIQPDRHAPELVPELHRWAVGAHRHLADLPGLSAHVIGTWTELPRWLDVVEGLLVVAEADGVDGSDAVAVVNAAFAYVLARAQFREQVGYDRDLAPLRLDPDRYPCLVANRAEYETPDVDRHFLVGLQAILAAPR